MSKHNENTTACLCAISDKMKKVQHIIKITKDRR